MAPSVFLSYSRRETPFVNQLSDFLEDSGVQLWLDYKSLVPAEPWDQQIENGLVTSDICLLVVSEEALDSKYVELEWKRALALKKRIILAIYQAIPLPPELQGCEWVDLRVDFNRQRQKLLDMLEGPAAAPTTPPPQHGVSVPWQVWGVIGLSALLMVMSLPSWWTLIVPYVLALLPWQAYKRRFNFNQARFVVVAAPVFTLFSSIMLSSMAQDGILKGIWTQGAAVTEFIDIISVLAILVALALFTLLHSAAWDRWARPEATRSRFANPLDPKIDHPRPVRFAIEHAPEDGQYAEDLQRVLVKYGHQPVAPEEAPEAGLVLVSTHHTTTTFDPDKQEVFPIILQAVQKIDPALQRIQWIDMRRGISNASKLAQLLPEPVRLLKALAVAPSGSQAVYPLPIALLLLFLLVSGAFTGGAILVTIIEGLLAAALTGFNSTLGIFLTMNLFNGGLVLLTVFIGARAVNTRRGGAAAVYPLLVLFALQLLNVAIALAVGSQIRGVTLNFEASSYAFFFALGVLLIGGVIVGVFGLLRWGDVRRWMPRRTAGEPSRLEKILLFYTPQTWLAWLVHIMYHSLLIFAVVLVNLSLEFGLSDGDTNFMYPLLLAMMAPLYFWARRLDKKARAKA